MDTPRGMCSPGYYCNDNSTTPTPTGVGGKYKEDMGPDSNLKIPSYPCIKSHCGDNMVFRSDRFISLKTVCVIYFKFGSRVTSVLDEYTVIHCSMWFLIYHIIQCFYPVISGSVQDCSISIAYALEILHSCRISSALTMEILQFCTEPSIFSSWKIPPFFLRWSLPPWLLLWRRQLHGDGVSTWDVCTQLRVSQHYVLSAVYWWPVL